MELARKQLSLESTEMLYHGYGLWLVCLWVCVSASVSVSVSVCVCVCVFSSVRACVCLRVCACVFLWECVFAVSACVCLWEEEEFEKYLKVQSSLSYREGFTLLQTSPWNWSRNLKETAAGIWTQGQTIYFFQLYFNVGPYWNPLFRQEVTGLQEFIFFKWNKG